MMTYIQAMLKAVTGTPVRRFSWNSPKQVVIYDNKNYTRTTPFRNGHSNSQWHPKPEDRHATDWLITTRYANDWWEMYYSHSLPPYNP